ncbi:hypothetical protein M3204_18540 [Mesobacillus subterraneus]|uniref:hypothetical protein n=1 Tax=Mesobacillus subterraneus TaxID=285983 RepID=UPI00203BB807|nr:hypothetical protein [Mesobacillus subterraneus]MCM3666420.1 hypothetical protein [Mesobacillus subterraneus]MCM3685419.1 hypothetical protein [Mesobacillus subterraneus]
MRNHLHPAGAKRRGGSAPAKKNLSLKKLALELFHNSSPAESEAPGTKINSLV